MNPNIDKELQAHHARLAPYASYLLEQAQARAHWMHAEQLSLEHLMGSLMTDEDCAAYRTVLHGFGDPETLATEFLAISPGILVVSSSRSLPFSPSGVASAFRALELARELGSSGVRPGHVLWACAEHLDKSVRTEIDAAGFDAKALRSKLATGPTSDDGPTLGASVFHAFDNESRKALSRACRTALRFEREAITPVHLLLAILEVRTDELNSAGMTMAGAHSILRGKDEDSASCESGKLAPAENLTAFLEAVPNGADSLALLSHAISSEHLELTQILRRNKVTPQLVERARKILSDPDSAPQKAGVLQS